MIEKRDIYNIKECFFMNLLQIFFIISAVVILLLAVDISKKQRFNALHFLVFIFMWLGLLIFTVFPWFLNATWNFFWLQRGADLLVYSSIIFLVYFVLLLLSKHVENKETITRLVREVAIQNSSKNTIHWKEVFIIPCYNESSVIGKTIESIRSAWVNNIIIINDGSSDDSKVILDGIKWEDLIVLHHYTNRGQWAALETWFEYVRRYSKTQYVVTFDADGQHDVTNLERFYGLFDTNKKLEVVFWSRFIKKTNSNVPILRRVILKLAILFTFVLSQIQLTDTHNGYRVIRRHILDKIHISIDWMWHASEIIDIIANKKIQHWEVPVDIRYTEYSMQKWVKNSNAIWMALRIIWTKFFK